MKIFISHSGNYDYEKMLYKPLRNSRLNVHHEIFLPHEDGKNVLTKDIIKTSDIVIAEVSYPSTGQGIELGWANTFNIPIVCIYRKTSKPPRSLKYLTKIFITYKNQKDMVENLIETLDKIDSSPKTKF